jgi:hypothetical protein
MGKNHVSCHGIRFAFSTVVSIAPSAHASPALIQRLPKGDLIYQIAMRNKETETIKISCLLDSKPWSFANIGSIFAN